MASPHDAIFRYTFAAPEHAGPLLAAMLPPGLARAIDWRALRALPGSQVDRQDSRADLRLRRQQSDLLFTAPIGGRPALLYLLVEHKSRSEPWTALQMASYVLGILRALRRRRPRPTRLPPVVPLVLHHGPQPFGAPTDLRDLLDVAGLDAAVTAELEPLLPRFPFLLRSLFDVGEDDLRALALTLLGKLTLAALQFVARRRTVDAVAAIARWADLVHAVLLAPNGREALDALSCYLIEAAPLDQDAVADALERHVNRQAAIIMKTAAARLRAEGRAEGKAEGKAEGRAELVLRQLRKRFGPVADDHARRVHTASIAELDRWADRLLDAATIAEVFAD